MPDADAGNTIAEIARLMGDVARAKILSALMSGLALTAGELARHAGVTAQTASGHLAKLADAWLISLVKQGRHRYYRLASPEVALAVQALVDVAATGAKRRHQVGPRDEALRMARTCYDHIAGRLALALADALCARGHVALVDGVDIVTDEGARFFTDFGIQLATESRLKRPVCRTCLDWSERRPHLAGQLGASLLGRLVELKWIVRDPGSRALNITTVGQQGLIRTFHLAADWASSSSAE